MPEMNSMRKFEASPVETLGPLLLAPILKQARWGGTRLEAHFGKKLASGKACAESWEVADFDDCSSSVVGGSLDRRTLHELMRDHSSELLGRHNGCPRFPLLCKFLDAADRLSVQVHPDDEYAAHHGLRYGGKSEAWVILEADSGSRIYAGLRPGVNRDVLQEAVQLGSVAECLESLVVQSGDCFNIPAGTVHAIGEGILLAEIQQPSDVTFRLFDWNRTDADGCRRPLHVAESLDCIDFEAPVVRRAKPVRLSDASGIVEHLLRTPYFEIRRHRGPGSHVFEDDDRFHVLMVIDGLPSVTAGPETFELSAGRTVLLPAHRPRTTLRLPPGAVVLDSFLPERAGI